MSRKTAIIAAGDVFPDRADPKECFTFIRDTIRRSDIAFCQLEGVLTERGTRLPQAAHTVRAPVATATALKDAGFSVVSIAGNHCMDWAAEGLFDTIDMLTGAGLEVVGGGANIQAARRAAMVEDNGKKMAFLAYSSILPEGYWAEDNRPGCAPMRAFTVYEQVEHDQPGTPARVHTFPRRDDLKKLVQDVEQAKSKTDFVAVSIHWGIHFVPAELADYQRDVAYAAIDAGADVILGHHAHILKGVEIYKGRPIFYSLCNLAVDLRIDKKHAESAGFKQLQTLNPDWHVDYNGLYNFPTESRMSMLVKLSLTDGKFEDARILPLYINSQAQPEILAAGDDRFEKVRTYLEEISQKAGLSTRFEAYGDELLISV